MTEIRFDRRRNPWRVTGWGALRESYVHDRFVGVINAGATDSVGAAVRMASARVGRDYAAREVSVHYRVIHIERAAP